MAVKVGSLLIEVASGVARVESDMKKISKILDSNTAAWSKMFNTLKVVAGGWLAKEVLRDGLAAFADFTKAGLEGAAKLQDHAAAAKEFKLRMAELSQEFERFSGEVIGPMLPMVNNSIIGMTAFAKQSGNAARELASLVNKMPAIPSWTPLIGGMAEMWRKSAAAIGEYAAQERALEAQRKKSIEDPLLSMLPTEEDMAVDDEIQRQREAREKVRATEKAKKDLEAKREKARVDEQEFEQLRKASDMRAQILERNALERGRVSEELRMQTEQGRREQLEEQAVYELSLGEWTEKQRMGIIKRYGSQERALTQARYAAQMQTTSSALGAMTQLLGATLGENHKMTKAFAIAEALVNTYAGVTEALRFYPPPQSWIMAATTLAMGFKQISAIKSTNPGGGGGASGGLGGGGGATSVQDFVPPMAAESATKAEKQRESGKIEIHIQNMIGERSWVANQLVPLLDELNRNRGYTVEVAGR